MKEQARRSGVEYQRKAQIVFPGRDERIPIDAIQSAAVAKPSYQYTPQLPGVQAAASNSPKATVIPEENEVWKTVSHNKASDGGVGGATETWRTKVQSQSDEAVSVLSASLLFLTEW